MRFPRSSGLLLHPTSLPGSYGIGELGNAAFEFIDFAATAGIKLWQVLPLTPTGYGDSPYQAFSAFAGNPLLISLDGLVRDGVLDRKDLTAPPSFPVDRVDFGAVIAYKYPLLRAAAQNFFSSAKGSARAEYEDYVSANAWWLEDFALFMAAKEAHDLVSWTFWDKDLALRRTDALAKWSNKLAESIAAHKFWQYVFCKQWTAVREHCQKAGIRIMGDIPIYVAHDSADVWANPNLFYLDENGNPSKVAGVPPDYFSATGQLWGNPIYRWDVLKSQNYEWWVRRFRETLKIVDVVRLDHFRGFEAAFEIPAGETTAVNGTWVKGPGSDLFRVLTDKLGPLPVVAENLGVITPEVESIRNEFDYPGMAILQFAFSTDPQAPSFRPHNYVHNQVAYTGGHDNDTMCGWWNAGIENSTRSESDVTREKDDTAQYFGVTRQQLDQEVNWVFIREVMRSVANTVVIPVQDVLGIGSEARMNLPGSFGRWWQWRMKPGSLTSEHARRLRKFNDIYDR